MKHLRTPTSLSMVLWALMSTTPPVAAQWSGWPMPSLASVTQSPTESSPTQIALGRQAELQDDVKTAATHYETALRSTMAQIARAPAAFKPIAYEQLRSVIPHYARVMMLLGRLEEAEVALEHLSALPATPQATTGNIGFDAVRQALNALSNVGAQASAGMNQRLLVDGAAAHHLDTALRTRLPPTDMPSALLAELRARQGRTADVLALWQNGFQKEVQPLLRDDALQALTADNVVAAAWRMALALQAVGATTQAQEATRLALEQDRRRLRHWAGVAASVDVQLGGMLQHRRLAALSVQGALQARQHDTRDDTALRQALGAVAVAKGLPLRYAMRRRALLAELEGFRPGAARSAIERLEGELLHIPTAGEAGVRAWADWSNRYAAAWQPLMPQLQRAGLANVVAAEPAVLLQNIQRGLVPGEALVGFVVHEPLALASATPSPARLVRYTLGAGGISLHDVGSRRDVERQVSAWRTSSDPARQHVIGRDLAKVLLRDLPPAVRAAPRWVIDPDGLLALLPFEALPDEDGNVLLERRTIRYVTSLAQLAEQPQGPAARGMATALVLADPAYPAQPGAAANKPDGASSMRGTSGYGRLLRDLVFTPLPDTRTEGEAVQKSLSALGMHVQLQTGAQAQPDALRNAPGPTFLHVASHAFVLPATVAIDGIAPQLHMIVPGLLAGLALATGDRGAVLSGHELATLNLRQTRLVVLSACDTGNGSLDVHEGLTSLRRAAEEAGARATVTSLWPVPSAATTQLMTTFYEQLSAGRSHAEALRQAKLQQKQRGGGLREWAGFILAGADQ